MPQSGIYAISNAITGDVYIGSSCVIEKRWKRHLNELRQGIHHSQYLQRAFSKYGEDAFEFSVVEQVLPERKLLIEREQVWIETTHPTYNMNPFATNNQGMKASEATKQHLLKHSLARTPEQRRQAILGKRHTEETKRKMSEAALARAKSTEETRKILSESAKNRVYTDEGRLKRSEMMKRRHQEKPISDETRQKLSEANKRRIANESEEEKRIRIEKMQNGRGPISDETRQKMREAKVGKKQSSEVVTQRANAVRGIKRSEKTLAKMRETQQRLAQERKLAGTQEGRPHTEEARKRMSELHKERWAKKKALLAETQPIIQQSLFD